MVRTICLSCSVHARAADSFFYRCLSSSVDRGPDSGDSVLLANIVSNGVRSSVERSWRPWRLVVWNGSKSLMQCVLSKFPTLWTPLSPQPNSLKVRAFPYVMVVRLRLIGAPPRVAWGTWTNPYARTQLLTVKQTPDLKMSAHLLAHAF